MKLNCLFICLLFSYFLFILCNNNPLNNNNNDFNINLILENYKNKNFNISLNNLILFYNYALNKLINENFNEGKKLIEILINLSNITPEILYNSALIMLL